MKFIKLKLDDDYLHRAFRAKCSLDGTNMQNKLLALVENYIRGNEEYEKQN